MYVVVRRPVRGLSGLGLAWAAIPVVMSAFQSVYSRLFGCTSPSVTLDFDPEGRPGGRLYGRSNNEVNSIIISDFQQPISTAYGITLSDVDGHVWNPIFQYFVNHGGGWNIDVDSWASITVDFFNWLASQGKPTDPRPYFSAHDSFKVAMEASCGSGRTKQKSFQQFSSVADQLYQKISASLPSSGGGAAPTQASILSGISPIYLVLGGLGAIMFLAARSKKGRAQPQIIQL